MDALTAILSELRLSSSLFCSVKAQAPWAVEVPAEDAATFHLLTTGQYLLNVEGLESKLLLNAGDIVVLPLGHPHVLNDILEASAPRYSSSDLAKSARTTSDGVVQIGNSGSLTAFMCGTFRFAVRKLNPILSVLPPIIHVKSGSSTSATWLMSCLQAIGEEMSSQSPGANLIVNCLYRRSVHISKLYQLMQWVGSVLRRSADCLSTCSHQLSCRETLDSS